MWSSFWKKNLLFGIIMLFIGTSIFPGICGDIEIGRNLTVNQSQETNSESTVDWWPMFHHDLQHTGYTTSTGPETNRIEWTYKTSGSLYSSPSVVDDLVYIGSWEDNKVYCLNADTGAKIWEYTTAGTVNSCPTIVEDKVYIGSFDCGVYCLNADTGMKIWKFMTGGYVASSPAVAYGKIYVGSYDGKVYCLDMNTGNLSWSYRTNDEVDCSPAISDGNVYIGSEDKKMYCLDADTGEWIWDFTAGDGIRSSPTIINNKVYVGSYDSRMYCLNADTGSKIWDFSATGGVWGSPAVANGKVFFGAGNGRLYCLNADTGLKIWEYTTADQIASSPAVTTTKVYFGSKDMKVYCLNSDTGVKIWEYTTGAGVSSSPAIADGRIFIGSWDRKIYCFEDNNTPDIPSVPIGPYYLTVDHSYSYETKTIDINGDRVKYCFDWGDDNSSWTDLNESGQSISLFHIWRNVGIYQIKVKAQDEHGAESAWSQILTANVSIAQNHKPEKPIVEGEIEGKKGKRYTYCATSIDPDGDQIEYYLWEWGDGNKIQKDGPFPSGEEVCTDHIWEKTGNYYIYVWAQDINGAISYRSDPFLVSVKKSFFLCDTSSWMVEKIISRFLFLPQYSLFNR